MRADPWGFGAVGACMHHKEEESTPFETLLGCVWVSSSLSPRGYLTPRLKKGFLNKPNDTDAQDSSVRRIDVPTMIPYSRLGARYMHRGVCTVCKLCQVADKNDRKKPNRLHDSSSNSLVQDPMSRADAVCVIAISSSKGVAWKPPMALLFSLGS